MFQDCPRLLGVCLYKPEILTARYGLANSQYLLKYLTKGCISEFTGKLKEVNGGGCGGKMCLLLLKSHEGLDVPPNHKPEGSNKLQTWNY